MEIFNRIWNIFSSYDPSSTDNGHSNEAETTKTNNVVKRSDDVKCNQYSIVTRSSSTSYIQPSLECQKNARKGFKDIFSLPVNYASCSTGERVAPSNSPRNDPLHSRLTPSQPQIICTQHSNGKKHPASIPRDLDLVQYNEISRKKASDVDILQSTLKTSTDLDQSKKYTTTITSKQEKNVKKTNITTQLVQPHEGFQPNSSAVALHHPTQRITGI